MNEGAKREIPDKSLDIKVQTYLSAHLIFPSKNYKKLRKVYYFNISLILQRMKQMRNFRQMKINFRYGIRIIKRALNIPYLKIAKRIGEY